MFQCSQHLNHVDENVISSAKFLVYSKLFSKLIVSAVHIQAWVQRQSVLTWGRCKGGSPHTRSKQCTSRKRFISTARKISCFSWWSVLNLRQISAQGCQAKTFLLRISHWHILDWLMIDIWYQIPRKYLQTLIWIVMAASDGWKASTHYIAHIGVRLPQCRISINW